MKKNIVLFAFVLCCAGMLNAQNVLSGYNGFWRYPRRINIIDLIEYYPDRLPYLRNEIYARYGRPFATQTYRDYFRAQSWYQEKSNFADSWLSADDRANAEFILSVEQPARNIEQVTTQLLRNIEYTDGQAVLTFTSRTDCFWQDKRVDTGFYGVNGQSRQPMSWFVMGDWVLVYTYIYNYNIIAYKLDHTTRKIVSTPVEKQMTSLEAMERILRSQGKPYPK